MDTKDNLEAQAHTLLDLTNDLRLPKEFRKFLYTAVNSLEKGKLAIEECEKRIANQQRLLDEQQKLIDAFQQGPPVYKTKPEPDLER